MINDCIRQYQAAPAEANFGFIYATDAMSADIAERLKQCKATTGIEHWPGSIGLAVITTGQEKYELPTVTIMRTSL